MSGIFRAIYVRLLSLSVWKKIGILVLLITGVLVSIFLSRILGNQSGYVFDTVKQQTIKEIVSDSGTIVSDGKIEVYSPTNGIVTAVMIENGQSVHEDDQLFTVKSSATAQDQQNAYASYQSAVANQNAAEALLHTYRSTMFTQWKSFTDLATNSTYESSKGVPNVENRKSAEFISSQEDWLAAEKLFVDQEQAVAAAGSQVNAAWNAYLATQTTTVTAQIGGVIANLAVSPGKSVEAPALLNTSATPVLTIVNSQKVEAVLNVGQTDIAKVKKGQDVIIHPDPYKDIQYTGKVDRVDSLGNTIQGVVTYNVYVAFTSSDEILRSGMTVDGDIVTNVQEKVLAVPNAAVVLNQGKKTVRILKNNSIVYVPVTIGVKGESYTQILQGLREGQQVIVALSNEKAAKPSFIGL